LVQLEDFTRGLRGDQGWFPSLKALGGGFFPAWLGLKNLEGLGLGIIGNFKKRGLHIPSSRLRRVGPTVVDIQLRMDEGDFGIHMQFDGQIDFMLSVADKSLFRLIFKGLVVGQRGLGTKLR